MALNSSHIQFLKSARLTDQVDGGGQITATPLPDNVSNNLFPGVSNLDAVNGRVSARLLYLATVSPDTLWYYGAGVYLSAPPENSAISALLARASAFGEERADLITRVESYLTQGPITLMTFFGNAVIGQRAVRAYQTVSTPLPETGETYLISQEKSGYPAVAQYVRLTDVEFVDLEFEDAQGVFTRRVLTLYLAEPLRYDFAGLEFPDRLVSTVAPTRIRYTTVADAARYYGLLPLAAEAASGQAQVSLTRLLESLVPSTQTETAQADLPAQALPQQLFPCGEVLTLVSDVTATTLYLGMAVTPGTVSVTGTQTYTDTGTGTLVRADEVTAEIDYTEGLIVFPESGTWTVTAQPAAPLIGPAYTVALPITTQTRALVYVTTLTPIPAPGTLVVDYLALGKWYRLTDRGDGVLAGASSAHGSGALDFVTGTAQLSLQTLPDTNTALLFAYALPLAAERRDGEVSIPAPSLAVTLEHAVEPATLTVSWPSGGLTKTATASAQGVLSGDATGMIGHETKTLVVTPDAAAFPDAGSVFTVDYDRLVTYSGALAAIAPTGRSYTLQLPEGACPLAPGSVRLTVTLVRYQSAFVSMGTVSETFTLVDDGAGAMTGEPLAVASAVNYTTGEVILILPDTVTRGYFEWRRYGGGIALVWNPTGAAPLLANTYAFGYQVRNAADGVATVQELIAAPGLTVDLTPTTLDVILPGSVRFLLGGQVHVDRLGTLYRAPSATTGSGTPVGSVNYTTGQATLTDWRALSSLALTVQALATVRGAWSTIQVFGRVRGAPVRPGSFQLRATTALGVAISATADPDGAFETDAMIGSIDWQTGIYQARFGERVLDADLTPEQKAESWYDADLIDEDGKVLVPAPVIPTSLVYNAVVYTYAPVDSTLIGVDTARLPADGRVQVIRPGDTAILHHTASLTMPTPLSAGQQVDCQRGHLSQVILLDTAGTQVATTKYSVNLATGIITMANPLDLSAYIQPLTAQHTLREMARVVDVEISGAVRLARALTKTFPVGSYLSTLLPAGDRYARYADLRVIASWQGDFTTDGALAAVDYNEVDYPLQVTNEGCIEEDWAIVFETASTVKVIGARVGQIASGLSITGTIAPTSTLTGLAYFSINPDGWGQGYAYGNALRFITVAASFPHWHIRCTQPHDWDGSGDVYAFQSLGEVDP